MMKRNFDIGSGEYSIMLFAAAAPPSLHAFPAQQ